MTLICSLNCQVSAAPDVRWQTAPLSLNRALTVLCPSQILELSVSRQFLVQTHALIRTQTDRNKAHLTLFCFTSEVLRLTCSTNKYKHVGMWLSQESLALKWNHISSKRKRSRAEVLETLAVNRIYITSPLRWNMQHRGCISCWYCNLRHFNTFFKREHSFLCNRGSKHFSLVIPLRGNSTYASQLDKTNRFLWRRKAKFFSYPSV